MNINFSIKTQALGIDVATIADLIVEIQRDNGEIPWSIGDKTDPWDHVEAAMGLSIAGYFDRARMAFEWLRREQLQDGSWYAAYRNSQPQDRTRDANMSAYIAVGIYHYYLTSGDLAFVERMWPTVARAIEFAISLQAPGGEIYWAKNTKGQVDRMALLTGSSSVFMSLKCALALARLLGCPKPDWESALKRLGAAITTKPHHFNMTKSRFSMDWFYPILCGAIRGDAAHRRIEKTWKKFVVDGMGVRCVSDQPWITIAETSELIITLAAMGNHTLARILFNWIGDHVFDDASFWCGFTFPDMILWPEEKISWTNAVVLLAADSLYDLTPAGRLFSHRFWERHDTLNLKL
jgi:hypothetical protein